MKQKGRACSSYLLGAAFHGTFQGIEPKKKSTGDIWQSTLRVLSIRRNESAGQLMCSFRMATLKISSHATKQDPGTS